MKSVESVLRPKDCSLYGRKDSHVLTGRKKGDGVMDGESGESTEGELRCGRNKKRQFRDRETGMSLMEGSRELIPDTR